jgi:outer membrane protein
MMKTLILRNLFFYLIIGYYALSPVISQADDSAEKLSLKDTIAMAIEANLNLKQSREEVLAAEETRKASITRFLPTLSASYDYLHRNKPQTQELTGIGPAPEFIVRPEDQYTFVTRFNQPIFRGFSLINQYRVADLGLDAAEFSEKVTRQDVILDAKNAFYSVLKAEKLLPRKMWPKIFMKWECPRSMICWRLRRRWPMPGRILSQLKTTSRSPDPSSTSCCVDR